VLLTIVVIVICYTAVALVLEQNVKHFRSCCHWILSYLSKRKSLLSLL